MRAVECSQAGGPDVLRLADRPMPSLRPDEVLIKVHAAGLNHADLAQRAGKYPLPAGTTDILGLEVAGEIVEAGADATGWRAGDKVCALLAGGGYAEFVAAPAAQCLPIPRGLDFVEAAVLPEACATVWLNLFQKAALQPGERLLVHGGSSGVGVMAIQLARALGATVYSTAGTDEKCRACETHGARRAINYRCEDFETVLTEEVGKHAMNVVFDMVGGDYFEKNVRVLAREERMAYISALGGRKVELDLVDLMRKRLAIFGSVLRPLSVSMKGAILKEMAAVVWPLLEARSFRPSVFREFAFDKAAEAHALMEAHGHVGKVALVWPHSPTP